MLRVCYANYTVYEFSEKILNLLDWNFFPQGTEELVDRTPRKLP